MKINILDFVFPFGNNLACFYLYGWLKRHTSHTIEYVPIDESHTEIPIADMHLVSIFVQPAYDLYCKLKMAGRIVVGGPYVHYMKSKGEELVRGFAEPWLAEVFNGTTGRYLLVPENAKLNDTIYYPNSYGCYWGKCKFCDYSVITPLSIGKVCDTPLSVIERELTIINNTSPNRFIFLTGEAITGEQIENIDRICENLNLKWGCFARGDAKWLKASVSIKKIRNLENVFFGIECMSDLALRLMQKGTNVRQLHQSISIAFEATGIDISAGVMTHFPFNKKTSKIVIAESLENLSKVSHMIGTLYLARTTLYPGTPWHKEFAKEDKIYNIVSESDAIWFEYSEKLKAMFGDKIVSDTTKVINDLRVEG